MTASSVITLRLPRELHERLKKRAAQERISENELCVRAISKYLESRDHLHGEHIEHDILTEK